MLQELPITNVSLRACYAGWEQMTPTERGRHCAQCNRVVHDFTQATAADLVAARAASADGRVCGHFRISQLAPASRPRLGSRLRIFLSAAVLVLLQGLTGPQAWTQLKTPVHPKPVQPALIPETTADGIVADEGPAPTRFEGRTQYTSVDQMPVYKDGGTDGIRRFLQQHLRYPPALVRSQVEGKVFVNFVVDRAGRVREPHILKGLEPHCDAEALRVINMLGPFIPGTIGGRPVDVSYTIPIVFSIQSAKSRPKSAAK